MSGLQARTEGDHVVLTDEFGTELRLPSEPADWTGSISDWVIAYLEHDGSDLTDEHESAIRAALTVAPAPLATAYAQWRRLEDDVEEAMHRKRVAEEVQRRATGADAPAPGSVGRSAAQLLEEVPPDIAWLVPGLLGKDWMVKIAAREKAGKGVFTCYLLGCLERGELSVFGESATATAVMLTEEPADTIREKIEDAGLRKATVIYGHELAGVGWPAKVEHLVATAALRGHGIVFVDNISRSAEIVDENGTEMGRAAELLAERAKGAGLAVIINHHHKKGGADIEDKSRGGTALAAACDVNVEMVRKGGSLSRIRQLTSIGRVKATVWEKAVELAEDHKSYRLTELPPDVDKKAEELGMARMHLKEMGSATAVQFSEKLGVSDSTAKRRLGILVKEGFATKAEKSGSATVWHNADGDQPGPSSV